MSKLLTLILFLLSTSLQLLQAKEVTPLAKLMYGDYWEPIKVDTKEDFIYVHYFLNNYLLATQPPRSYNEVDILKSKCNELGRLFTLLDFVELNKDVAPKDYLNNKNSLALIKSLQADVKNRCRATYNLKN